jgi:hypothetical protein
MGEDRKKERREAPGGGIDPEDAHKKRDIKEPAVPAPTDEPDRGGGNRRPHKTPPSQ